jgi:hypothetical protein
MQTFATTWLLESRYLESYIGSTELQSTGFQRNKAQSRQPRTDPNMAARLSVEHIKALGDTLRYLGVPLRQTSYMFGDNKSVFDSSMRFDAKLHKRHTALSFHKVREVIAARMIIFTHILGALNPADILSKHWEYATVWKLLRPLLFWKGDPANIPEKDNSRHVGIQDQAQAPDLVLAE